MNADIIFVVSDGEIVEQGSHEELLVKKGKYSELWSKQIFVKPKELKGDSMLDEAPAQGKNDSSNTDSAQKSPTHGDPSEIPPSESSSGTTNVSATSTNNPTSISKSDHKASIPKLVTTPAKASNGHKKEVDQSKNP